MPKISPSRTSRETSFTVSPGISTARWLSFSATGASGRTLRGSAVTKADSPLRPIIISASRVTSVSFVRHSATSFPSRRMVMPSAALMTSSSLCVIKMMAMPRAAISFITLRSCAASLSVSTAVGSSNTSSFTPRLSISRAISTNCI